MIWMKEGGDLPPGKLRGSRRARVSGISVMLWAVGWVFLPQMTRFKSAQRLTAAASLAGTKRKTEMQVSMAFMRRERGVREVTRGERDREKTNKQTKREKERKREREMY